MSFEKEEHLKKEQNGRVRIQDVHDDMYGTELDGLDQAGTVSNKYRGTAADRRDMMTLGKQQVLRRNFRFLSMLGFGSTLLCTWEVMLSQIIFVLTNGGTAGLFWGYTVVMTGTALVYASLAEMSSMAPTAGGQYHWVSEFAPPKYQKFLSYLVGWLCATGWQAGLVSIAFLVGTIIQGLVVLNDPTYAFERWHGTLLVIAITAFSIIFNTVLAKRLPMIEGIVLIIHIMGLFAVIIPMWVLAPRASPQTALLEFTNNGGWQTTGLSVMVGLLTPMGSLLGFDCAVHMSEEVKDAGETLPKAMMWSVLINSSMGYIMAITICFTLGDVTSILTTPTGYPFIQVFYNITQSYAGTNTMVAIIIITLTSSCISEVATASRQIWSFARDNGLPFSGFLSQVSPGWNIPLRAVLVSLGMTIILALINIGSSAALNAIVSLSVVSLLTSYYITIGCVVLKRLKGEPLPARRWSLGRFGLAINIASLVFLTPIWFFAFWPLATPTNPSTMNWAIVMYGGMITISMGYYIVKGRHVYTGPVVLTKRDI